MVDQNVKKFKVSKLLKLELLTAKMSTIPQMKAIWPKIKLIWCRKVVQSPKNKNHSFCVISCNHKLGSRLVLLRAETGSLLTQVGGHIGSTYGRGIGGVASTSMSEKVKNHYFHEKQCESLYIFYTTTYSF